MPIHTSWKTMINSMKKQYPGTPEQCRDFIDGSKICASKKAWSVFFATMNQKGWDETKPASNLALATEELLSRE